MEAFPPSLDLRGTTLVLPVVAVGNVGQLVADLLISTLRLPRTGRLADDALLPAVGGAAYLVAKAIKAASVVGFADLGMEAIYEFEVKDMPVTVAVDSSGTSVHQTGPREWQSRIGKIPVTVA